MFKLLRRVHFYYFAFCLFGTYLLFWPFYYLFSRYSTTYGALNWARKLNGFLCCTLGGVFFKFHYEEKLDPKKTYIFCANHTSNLDIIICCMLARGKFHFMGKTELLANPFLSIFFKTIDVPVDRTSRISSFKAFRKVSENLQKGMSLFIFPEGGIDNTFPPKLQQFKSGPFRLAIDHQLPIVPISIANVWQVFWDDGLKYGTRPGIVNIYVHQPISTAILAAENSELLSARVFDIINSKL